MKKIHHAVMHGLLRSKLTIKYVYPQVDNRKIKDLRTYEFLIVSFTSSSFPLTKLSPVLRGTNMSHTVS